MADKRQLLRYKGDCCASCGFSVAEIHARYRTVQRVFQFHHTTPEKKHPEYDNLIRRKLSTEQLDELDKCVLLCSVCHGLVEEQTIRATAHLSVTLEERTVEQVMWGHVLVDYQDGQGQFLTNERFKLTPYLVRAGTEAPRTEFDCELENGRLRSYLSRLSECRSVSVFNYRGNQCLMLATFLDGGMMEITHDVRFQLFTCEMRGETNVWTRNGTALIENGEVWKKGEVSFKGNVPVDLPARESS